VLGGAPGRNQQAALGLHGGPRVDLGNVKARDVLGLEAMRCGLRFETLRHYASRLEITALAR